MRTRVRIREGVSRGLCGSCQHARTMVDDRDHAVVICEENQMHRVMRPLTVCTDYLAIGQMTKWDMEKAAWILEVERGGRVVGFTPPKKDEL